MVFDAAQLPLWFRLSVYRKTTGQTDKGLFSAVVVPGEVGILDIFQIVSQKNARNSGI